MQTKLLFLIAGSLILLNVCLGAAKTCADQPMLSILDKFLSKHDGYLAGRPKGQHRGDNEKPKDQHQKPADGQSKPADGNDKPSGQTLQNGGKRFLAEEKSAADQKNAQEGKKAAVESAVAAFKSASAATASNLKICKDYNGKNSCCTSDFEDQVLSKVIKGYFAKQFEKLPKNIKDLRGILHRIGKCMSKEEMVKLQQNEDLKQINKEFRKCHKDGIIAQLNLVRGTVCSLCVDPAQIDTYFTVGATATNLKINSSNFNEYSAEIQKSFTCFEAASEKFKSFIESYSFGDKCSAHLEKIKKFLSEGKHKIPKQDCKKDATLLGEGCGDKLNDDGKNDAELSGDANGRRILNSEGGYTEDAAGLNAYQVDAEANAALLLEGENLDKSDLQKEQEDLKKQLDDDNKNGQTVLSMAFLLLIISMGLII